MSKKLTARFVETVVPQARRVEYRDAHTRGLVLRVTPKGVKTWAVIYTRKSDGKKRRITIGTFPGFGLEQARCEAQAILAEVARGEDPANKTQLRKQFLTFEGLSAAWVERHGKPNKSLNTLYDDQLMLSHDILPAIGAMKAEEVTKRDVIEIIDEVAKRGAKYRSNRVLALTRSIFRWGSSEDLIRLDPTQGVRPRTIERPRDRVLSDEEIRKFWRALNNAPMTFAVATILRLALVTGQRIGEVAGMTKAEIAFAPPYPVWTLPGKRTKNRLVTRIPLSPLATELLEAAITEAGDSSYVFPSRASDAPISAHAATRAIARARAMLGIDNFRVHDLRRTVATSMASLGINPYTISLVLDHVSVSKGTVTGAVYVRYSFDQEKRHALITWANHLESLIR